MTEQGVPQSALVPEHIQVRAPLVKLLGGANEAIIWERIRWRCESFAHAHEYDGRAWWEATMTEIGSEVGLSMDQVKRAVRTMLEQGFLLGEQHSLPRQTYSYSPVILQSAVSPIGIGRTTDSNRQDRQLQSAESPIAPLYRDIEDLPSPKKRETPLPKAWAPTVEHIAFAKERGVDVIEQADNFRLHAETHDRRAANWNGAFTWWLKKSKPAEVVPAHLELGQEWMAR